MPTFTSDSLHALSRAVCAASGSAEREAPLIADHLVEANLTGHDCHGVGPLPGKPERRRRVERLAHGIEVDERTWEEIVGAARSLEFLDEQIADLTA